MDTPLAHLSSTPPDRYSDAVYPKVSVIIPTYNCAQWMTVTLESLVHQDYPDLEIIVIDARSTDRTVAVVKSYHHQDEDQLTVHSVSCTKLFEMINTGLSHCHGTYINVLLPGDFYVHPRAVRTMMTLACDHQWPEMVYCGSVVHGRDGRGSVIHKPFSVDLLRRGSQPTNLQSCWIHRDVFRKIGKFSTDYQLRGELDFMARLVQDSSLQVVGTTQVLTDSDRILPRRGYRYLWETGQILVRQFGWQALVT